MRAHPAALSTVVAASLAAIVCAASVPAGAGKLSDADINQWRVAVDAADRGDTKKARAAAARAKDDALLPVIAWLDFRRPDTKAPFVDIAAFIADHPDWPQIETLRANAERRLLDSDTDPDEARAWLEHHPPVTGDGALAWYRAMAHVDEIATHSDDIARAWVDLDFSPEADNSFFNEFREFLSKDDQVSRLDRLIWERQYWPAQRMLDRVEPGQAALARARLALMRRKSGVDRAIARVPVDLRDAPELWYERLRWRRLSGFDETARLVLLDPPKTLTALPQLPRRDRWAEEGQVLARLAMNEGQYDDAYKLAAMHQLDRGVEFAESEFLAGWIGHSMLRDHAAALDHFTRLYNNVSFPISRARGAFWAGEAASAAGNPAAAGWYRQAGTYPTTFYGQAALQALGSPLPEVRLTAKPTEAARTEFVERDIVAVVRRLGEIERPHITRLFLLRMMYASEDADEMLLVSELALAANQPLEALRAAKRAHREDGALSALAYPLIKLPPRSGRADSPEPALLLALIRQESGFDRRAVSGSGARGMMQLLPTTARHVARKLGLKYSKSRLTHDPQYNITLGSAYFGDLLERFDGEPALALAGYNGGPSNVERWLKTYGDPRRGEIGMIDWIESIPFSETRNYVQRVLEAVAIYRQLLGDPQVATVTIPVL